MENITSVNDSSVTSSASISKSKSVDGVEN